MTRPIATVRDDFPILRREFQGKPLVYLDNAATTQKPKQVVDALSEYYFNSNANVGRSVFTLSLEANAAYGGARNLIKKYIRAKSAREVIFTRGTTEGINLVAYGLGESIVRPGDEVLVTAMEHHGNLCPWQTMCARKGATLRIAPIDARGDLDLDAFRKLITSRTRIIAAAHISNVLGTVNPIEEMIQEAHKHGIPILIDGAQAAAHVPVNVQALDCDFYCFSGHKMYAPTGIGVLYAKEKWLEQMPPYQTGGGIVFDVSYEKITRLKGSPEKFEAGTPNVEGAVGLGAAVKYLLDIGFDAIQEHEHDLMAYAAEKLSAVPKLTIYGHPKEKSGLISFLIDGIHPYDVGNQANAAAGICMRTGVHCAIPLVDHLKLPVGTVRASFGIYNTRSEIDLLADVLKTVKPSFWTTQKPNDRM